MKTRKISSAAHPLIQQAAALARRRREEESGLFSAEGSHLVEAALEASAPIRQVFFSLGYRRSEEGERLLLRAERAGAELIEVPDHLLKKICDAATPQGIMAMVASSATYLSALPRSENPLLAVCDAISDPGNLGTIIRIADAAGADGVILLPGCCATYAPKVVRATSGSLFHLPMIRANPEELTEFLAGRGIPLLATDLNGDISLYDADLRGPCALVVGNESRGTSPFLLERAQRRLRIPMPGKAESLNAAVATALCLFEAVRQRSRPPQP